MVCRVCSRDMHRLLISRWQPRCSNPALHVPWRLVARTRGCRTPGENVGLAAQIHPATDHSNTARRGTLAIDTLAGVRLSQSSTLRLRRHARSAHALRLRPERASFTSDGPSRVVQLEDLWPPSRAPFGLEVLV